MGLDFIEAVAKPFQKKLDKMRVKLGTPDLLTQEPECAPRRYATTILENQKLSRDEQLVVCLQGDRVFVLRGFDRVAVLDTPNSELLEALKESHGEACCMIAEVYSCADTAEIIIS